MATYPYAPDYVALPGETLLEALEERQMTQTAFAQRIGRSRKFVNEIIRGKARISEDIALDLERVLNIPAVFWMNLERQYRLHMAQSEQTKRLAVQTEWRKRFPLHDMIQRGWIAKETNPVEQLRQLLTFFGMAYPDQWEAYWAEAQHAFRMAPAFQQKVDLYALAAWLRQGERQAQDMLCEPYNEQHFKQTLRDLRAATRLAPEEYYQQLPEQCALAGVAVVFVDELPHTHIRGATHWLSSSKAIIQLSRRYKASDHFWFTFYHGAGHILCHSKSATFIETDDGTDEREAEADTFARDMLISPAEWRRFTQERGPFTEARIRAFADAVGVGADIVAGRLKHEKRIRYMNHAGLHVALPPLPGDIGSAEEA